MVYALRSDGNRRLKADIPSLELPASPRATSVDTEELASSNTDLRTALKACPLSLPSRDLLELKMDLSELSSRKLIRRVDRELLFSAETRYEDRLWFEAVTCSVPRNGVFSSMMRGTRQSVSYSVKKCINIVYLVP